MACRTKRPELTLIAYEEANNSLNGVQCRDGQDHRSPPYTHVAPEGPQKQFDVREDGDEAVKGVNGLLAHTGGMFDSLGRHRG